MPDTEDTPDVSNLPVNVAPPNWQCPHCHTEYYTDLEKATACAHAGPAPAIEAGTPVLVLTGTALSSELHRGDDAPVFGLTEVGPVKAVRHEDGTRSHRRDVVIDGYPVDTHLLAGAPQANDGLLLLAERRNMDPHYVDLVSSSLNTYDTLSKLFLGQGSFGSYAKTQVTTWVLRPSEIRSKWETKGWHRSPDEQECAVLNVVTANLLADIEAADIEKLAESVRRSYRPGAQFSSGQSPAHLIGPESGLLIAYAHGATNHIWALRWLNAHLDAVIAWQVRTLKAWAAGEEVLLPCAVNLHPAESLPVNPGKRRMAVMEPFGDTYRDVADHIVHQLMVDEPTYPIPGLGDVNTMFQAPREGTDHV